MRALAVSAVVVALVVALAWLLGGFDGPARSKDQSAAAVGHEPTAEVAAPDELSAAPTSNSDSARRAADSTSIASPAGASSDHWIVVDHDTGTPIADATVSCVDPSGAVHAPVVDGGAFEPLGAAPYLLEIGAPDYALRWVVIDGDEPCSIGLRRAGALELSVVDESGSRLGRIDARFESETSVTEDLAFVRGSLAGARAFGQPSVDVVERLRRQTAAETFARFDPRDTVAIGPSDCMPAFNVGEDGAFGELAIPSGTRFRAVVEDAFIAHSEPAGALDASGDQARWITDALEVRPGETAQFRVVRRGSCRLSVKIDVGSRPMSDRALVFVLSRVKDGEVSPSGAAAPMNPGRHHRSGSESVPVLHWAGLEAGEYDLALQWSRYGTGASGKKLVEYCVAQRRFKLVEGESLTLEVLGPDPGLVELEIVFVDEHALADVTAEVYSAAGRPFELWSEFTSMALAGELSWIADTIVRAEGGFLRVVGCPPSGRTFKVSGSDDALEGTAWEVRSQTVLDVPAGDSVRLRAEVAVARTQACSFVLVRPTGAAPFDPSESFAQLTFRRIDGSTSVLLDFVTSEDSANGLRTETRLGAGAWFVCGSLETYRDDGSLFVFDHSPVARAPASPACRHVFGRFVVAADAPNSISLEAVDAAAIVLKHEAEDQWDLIERLRSTRVTVHVAGDSEPVVGTWSPSNAFARDDTSLLVGCLPPNALVRFEECDIEFHTGPPGSTIEVAVPSLALDDQGAPANVRDVEER